MQGVQYDLHAGEVDFISNTIDNRLFDESFDAYAEAIARGVCEALEWLIVLGVSGSALRYKVQDFDILFEFEKMPVTEHTVALTVHYVDGALPDETLSFTVADGDLFEHQVDVLQGYWLVNYMQRSFPVVDWDDNTITIESAEQSYDILLELDKADYTVSIVVCYDRGAIPDQVTHYTVTYGNPFTDAFTVEPGYTPYQTQAGPGVSVNIRNKTVTITSVAGDTEVRILCR